jgi:shikimate kinase
MRRVLKKSNRPLLLNDPEATMQHLMAVRYPVYALADITVESREVPHEAIVDEVISALAKRLLAEETTQAAPTSSEST